MAVIEAQRRRTKSGTRPFTDLLVAPPDLPGEAATNPLTALRSGLAAWLGDHPRRDDAMEVAVELVTNALLCGSDPGGLVSLAVERIDGGRLEICVRDEGRAEAESESEVCREVPGLGRGLAIVEDLCEGGVQWSQRRGGGRTYRGVLAATAPPVNEPGIDEVEALIAAYADGDDDSGDVSRGDGADDGGDGVC